MMDKVCYAPIDLGELILEGGKRQDGVVVSLSHGIPAGMALHICVVLGNNRLAGVRIVILHPLEQSWANIEADAFKITQLGIGAVALGMNAFIPI